MPFIPEQHKKYDMLPGCRKYDTEVFSYPCDLVNKLEQMLPDNEIVIPYGYSSYAAYYEFLDTLINRFGRSNKQLAESLVLLKAEIERMNQKEDWSILQYVGESTGILGLTHGKYYYWPCFADNPVYEGVIDDEEFTSYLYSTNPKFWKIAEDPLGMAKNTLG